jgi:carboxymethylenebutenolidase
MPNTTYPSSDGQLRGYLATPSTPGPWPGVVVIHEAFGLTDDMRHHADEFAAKGYLAFAPDLYSYGFAPACMLSTFRSLARGGRGGRALADIDKAREFVLAEDGCSGKVGIIGFCMGGGFAILAATRGFDVSAPNYGVVPRRTEEALRGSCAMVASYGKKDKGFKDAAAKLEHALEVNGVEHDVKEYPDAGHGFLTKHTGGWAWVERVPWIGPVEGVYDDAWSRVFTFFDRHLKASA